MSEDTATYYIPQARITQNQHGVWVMASDNTGVLIRYDDEGSHVAYVSNFADDVMAGREMVLVPAEEAMHPSWLRSIVRAWRKAGYAYRWWMRLYGEEHPNSAKAAAAFEDAIAAAMKADPMMDGVARAETTQFPRIVCLCGSTRFSEAFRRARLAEALDGNIVLTLGSDNQSDAELQLDDEALAVLATRHLRQIDLSDEIFVLNVGGYIGQSTAAEIAYARQHGKAVRFLEPEKA